jgi:hypothetical protein
MLWGVVYLPAVMMVMVMVVVTVVVTTSKSAAVAAAKSATVTAAKSAAVAATVTAVSKAQCGKKYGIGVGRCCQGGQKDLKKEVNSLKFIMLQLCYRTVLFYLCINTADHVGKEVLQCNNVTCVRDGKNTRRIHNPILY